MADHGQFCGAETKFASHVKKGDQIDFTAPAGSEGLEMCWDHGTETSSKSTATLTSAYVENLWNYEGYNNGDSLTRVPHWGNGIYQIRCFVPDNGNCSLSVTAQTLLDAFPAGSIALYQIDDSVETCASGDK